MKKEDIEEDVTVRRRSEEKRREGGEKRREGGEGRGREEEEEGRGGQGYDDNVRGRLNTSQIVHEEFNGIVK